MVQVNLKPNNAVAFDFDGVIHKYRDGWKDGSIYDEVNENVLRIISTLQELNIPCVIISTREPQQIKEWFDKLDSKINLKTKVLDFDTVFFNELNVVGITNRKIPAQLYIDDRAYRYSGQDVTQFFTLKGEEHTKDIVLKLEEEYNAKDVTDEYIEMIQVFECDFNLMEEGYEINFEKMFKDKNKEFLKDIELLRELSFKLRHGKVQIVEVKD